MAGIVSDQALTETDNSPRALRLAGVCANNHRMNRRIRTLPVSLLLLAAWGLTLGAVQPPAYLSVKDFEQCLAQQARGSHREWCLPVASPAACPHHSWQQLVDLKKSGQLAACHQP